MNNKLVGQSRHAQKRLREYWPKIEGLGADAKEASFVMFNAENIISGLLSRIERDAKRIKSLESSLEDKRARIAELKKVKP
jgi:hypothetical protein